MPKELETRVINVDKIAIIKKLEALGAKKIKEVLQKRLTFDFPDRRLDASYAWVRLRDTGDGIVELAYKCQPPAEAGKIADCDEVEFEVGDMNKTEQFLMLLGLERKAYQENRRTRYQLDDMTFDIDEWPMLKPLVEVEAASEEAVRRGIEALGYTMADTFPGNAGDVYKQAGIDWKALKEIKF